MKGVYNKKALVVTIICAVIIIALVVSGIIGGIFLFKKHLNIYKKSSITVEKFVSVMEKNDYKVIDVKDQFKDADIEIKEAYVAQKDNHQIEFYTLKNADDAELFYRVNKAKFDMNYATKRIEMSGKNYTSLNVETNDKYKFLERINETVIYINVDKEYKDNVKSIVKILGY